MDGFLALIAIFLAFAVMIYAGKKIKTDMSSGDGSKNHSSVSYTQEEAQEIGRMAMRHVEIINESFKIIDGSRNPSTIDSRLGVIEDNLSKVKTYLSQYPFLSVDKLDVVERQLKRARKDFEAREIKPSARELLKQATSLKADRRYDEACEKLIHAYAADDGGMPLMLKERLRLPMYLQLAGRSEEGWDKLIKLSASAQSAIDQYEVSNQMRIFLQKDKKHIEAVLYGVWAYVAKIDADKDMLDGIEDRANQSASMGFDNSDRSMHGRTRKGNPIHDSFYQELKGRIEVALSELGIKSSMTPLLKKAKSLDKLELLSVGLKTYLTSNVNKYEANEVRAIYNKVFEPAEELNLE